MAATAQLYLVMYILMFAAAIRLRYSQPDVARAYSVPGGRKGMWIVAGVAILGAAFAIAVFYLPQADTSPATWVGLLLGSFLFLGAPPFFIYHYRNPNWKTTDGIQD